MKDLKNLIDKRAEDKIRKLKEEEERLRQEEIDTRLSKKTSFSSFYNLEENRTDREVFNIMQQAPKIELDV